MSIVAASRADSRLQATETGQMTSNDVCAEVVRAVRDVARFDWGAVMTTDPETLLPSGGVVEGFDPAACAPFWDNELSEPDFNKYTDLVRRVDPVATLREAVDGDLDRSPRFRTLYQGLGACDELRVVFMAGASCLAVGVFLRAAADGPFTQAETARVRALVPAAASALRRAQARLIDDPSTSAPVVLMLDGDGEVSRMSAGGQEVLDDLCVRGVDDDFPSIVRVAVSKARGRGGSANVTTRLRGRSGRWLRLHVCPMDGGGGEVAVTVETARPDDLVRILLDAYGLTPRETDIVLRLCRGLTSKEIAAELFISAHTVRDHLKAIYDKAGVSSRGELVAELFSNHVLDRMHSAMEHVRAVG